MENNCSICCENTHGRKSAILRNCGHQFCLKCIKLWIIESSTCPLDRSQVESVIYVDISGRQTTCENVDRFITNCIEKAERKIFRRHGLGFFKYLSHAIMIRQHIQENIRPILEEAACISDAMNKERCNEIVEKFKNTCELLEKYCADMEKELCTANLNMLRKTFRELKKTISRNSQHSQLPTCAEFGRNPFFKINIFNLILSLIGDIKNVFGNVKSNLSVFRICLEEFLQNQIGESQFKTFAAFSTNNLCVRGQLLDTCFTVAKAILLQFLDLFTNEQYNEIFRHVQDRCELCQVDLELVNRIVCVACRRGLCANCTNNFIIIQNTCFFDCREGSSPMVPVAMFTNEIVLRAEDFKDRCNSLFADVAKIRLDSFSSLLNFLLQSRKLLRDHRKQMNQTAGKLLCDTLDERLKLNIGFATTQLQLNMLSNLDYWLSECNPDLVVWRNRIEAIFGISKTLLGLHFDYFNCLVNSNVPLEDTSLLHITTLNEQMMVTLRNIDASPNQTHFRELEDSTKSIEGITNEIINELIQDLIIPDFI